MQKHGQDSRIQLEFIEIIKYISLEKKNPQFGNSKDVVEAWLPAHSHPIMEKKERKPHEGREEGCLSLEDKTASQWITK